MLRFLATENLPTSLRSTARQCPFARVIQRPLRAHHHRPWPSVETAVLIDLHATHAGMDLAVFSDVTHFVRRGQFGLRLSRSTDRLRHHRNFIEADFFFVFMSLIPMTVRWTACDGDQEKSADKSAPSGPWHNRVGVRVTGMEVRLFGEGALMTR